MSLACTCTDWMHSIKELDGIINYASIHDLYYKGSKFVYCPWCGLYLKEQIS